MGMYLLEGALALLVVLGTGLIVWGVRRFNLPNTVLAITFAVTAISWIALIITTIGLTIRTLVGPSI